MRDFNNNVITSDTTLLDSGSSLLELGQGDTYSVSLDCGVTEPYYASVEYSVDYDELWESKSISAGVTGSILAAAGVYLICDYFFDITDVLNKNFFKINIQSNNDGLAILACRSF